MMNRFSPYLLSALMILATSVSQADAPNPFAVPVAYPAVQVSGLGSYKGQYLTVMYASGQMPGLANAVDHMHLAAIDAELANIQITDDSISLNSNRVSWTGFWKPNILVLVVHAQPDFTWQNIDGGQPHFPPSLGLTDNHQQTAVSTIGVQSLLSLADPTTHVAHFQFNLSLPINTLQILPDDAPAN